MDALQENMIEIAWIDQALFNSNMYKEDLDSLDRKATIIDLANRFEAYWRHVDWDKVNNNYYEEIDSFARRELLAEFGKENAS